MENSAKKYSAEHIQFLKDNVRGISTNELLNKFNNQFNFNITKSALMNLKTKYNLKNGIQGGQFKKGQVSFNKGKTWADYMPEESAKRSLKNAFKKGNVPKNHRPVGSERITKDGYTEIKIAEPNKWELKQRVIYIENFGNVPDGHNIIFLDGDRSNLDITNLKAISRAEDLIMNKNGFFTKDKEVTEVGANTAKLLNKLNKINKI